MSRAAAITRAQRRQIEAAAEVFKPWGLTYAVEMGGKHMTMKVIARDGVTERLSIACTPRNEGDAVDLTRQKAQRLVRQINERLGIYRFGGMR